MRRKGRRRWKTSCPIRPSQHETCVFRHFYVSFHFKKSFPEHILKTLRFLRVKGSGGGLAWLRTRRDVAVLFVTGGHGGCERGRVLRRHSGVRGSERVWHRQRGLRLRHRGVPGTQIHTPQFINYQLSTLTTVSLPLTYGHFLLISYSSSLLSGQSHSRILIRRKLDVQIWI